MGLSRLRLKVAMDVVVEVNSETDFVARDEGFQGFVDAVVDAGFAAKQTDMAAVMAGDLESAREALVQKLVRISRHAGWLVLKQPVVGGYVHSNNRIAVIVGLTGGDEDLARDVAMHVAAVNPAVVSSDQMPAE